MSRRRAIYCGSALAFFLAGSLSLWLWTRERITEENFSRIHAGMTQKDVENILGGPPGDYRRQKSIETYYKMEEHPVIVKVGPSSALHPVWWGTEGSIELDLSEDGRVQWTWYLYPLHSETTFWDRVRSWLPF
jgi:hypothetical protein